MVGDVLPRLTAKQRRWKKKHRGAVAREGTAPTKPPGKAKNSNPWWTTRADHLALFPECRICGATEHVHVHHLRYRGKRGLTERPGDLVTLCVDHHDEFHRIYGRAGVIMAQGKERLAELTIAFIEAKRRLPL